jgi:peptidoglycan/LPS O-acetylase OafA/YrhL
LEIAAKHRTLLEMIAAESRNENVHIPELDGIRGVAIALVLMFPSSMSPLRSFQEDWSGTCLRL